jgi:hypothetical protein
LVMDYSPFNPVVWTIFAGCIASIYLIVKVYHRKHPYYPYEENRREKPRNAVRRASVRRISGFPIGAASTEEEE